MSTIIDLCKTKFVEMTIDDKGRIELDLEYAQRDWYGITTNPQEALDLATKILYGVWVADPDLAEQRAKELAKDIPTVYNKLVGD